MKKKMLKPVAIILSLIMLLAYSPYIAWATHGFSSGRLVILVNGRQFELYGYSGDGPMPALRLQDLAYILNGTTAQFDIRQAEGGEWDYWIVRGQPYTVMGTELRYIPDRHALFGSYGFVSGYGFDCDPIQTAVIAVDGADNPSWTVEITVIRDIDETYFPFESLAYLLGFSWIWGGAFEADYIIETWPEPPPGSTHLASVLFHVPGVSVAEPPPANPQRWLLIPVLVACLAVQASVYAYRKMKRASPEAA